MLRAVLGSCYPLELLLAGFGNSSLMYPKAIINFWIGAFDNVNCPSIS